MSRIPKRIGREHEQTTFVKPRNDMLAKFWMIIIVVMVLTSPAIADEIKIASWNIQQLGQTKAGINESQNEQTKARTEHHKANDTIGKIAEIIKKGGFDIVAIQEVQDKARKTLPKLLETLGADWQYIESERTGRGRQEQYAIFFNPVKLTPKDTIHLYNDMEDSWDNFSRDPGYAGFSYRNFEFIIITCHLNAQQHAAYETERLDDVYEAVKCKTRNPNIFVLGDFNLEEGPEDIAFQDDGLLDEEKYPKMKAALDSTYDTTVAGENDETTYDNILFDSGQFELKEKGVYRFDDELGEGYDKTVSDHYPVWAIFEIQAIEDDTDALPFAPPAPSIAKIKLSTWVSFRTLN